MDIHRSPKLTRQARRQKKREGDIVYPYLISPSPRLTVQTKIKACLYEMHVQVSSGKKRKEMALEIKVEKDIPPIQKKEQEGKKQERKQRKERKESSHPKQPDHER